MKIKISILFYSFLILIGCSSTPNTETKVVNADKTETSAKKHSMYNGIKASQVKECMGEPVAVFTANKHIFWRYFTPSQCEVLFIIDEGSQTVSDVKYLFPHVFTRFGYAVSEKQCPLKQEACLLSKSSK